MAVAVHNSILRYLQVLDLIDEIPTSTADPGAFPLQTCRAKPYIKLIYGFFPVIRFCRLRMEAGNKTAVAIQMLPTSIVCTVPSHNHPCCGVTFSSLALVLGDNVRQMGKSSLHSPSQGSDLRTRLPLMDWV